MIKNDYWVNRLSYNKFFSKYCPPSQAQFQVHVVHGLAMIFLRDSLCLSADTLSRQWHDILDFSYCPLSRAFCMWHWAVGKDLDLRSIWGHHHLSECMDISRPAEYFIACYTVLKRPNKVETAVHGCNCWLSVWTLDHVIAPLSFLHSISLASLFPILLPFVS